MICFNRSNRKADGGEGNWEPPFQIQQEHKVMAERWNAEVTAKLCSQWESSRVWNSRGCRCTSSSCSSLMHKEVIASSLCGAVQGSTFQGGSPRCNGFIQTQGNLPPFLHAGLIIFHSLLPPPPHLSIAQTVVHLPPCATTSICSLLTWPFTSDPMPTILIKTKTHYGGFLFMLVSLSTFVCVCFSVHKHTHRHQLGYHQ